MKIANYVEIGGVRRPIYPASHLPYLWAYFSKEEMRQVLIQAGRTLVKGDRIRHYRERP